MPREFDSFYLGTIADIEDRIANGGAYNLLRASGLVRQLLLDKYSLVDIVNAEYRQKLRFRVLETPTAAVPPDYAWHPIDPDLPTPPPGVGTVKVLTREELWKLTCLISDGKQYSIKDVLVACANIHGGIHLDKPGLANHWLSDFDALMRTLQMPGALVSLKRIIRVILKGLEPLTDAVRRNQQEPK